MGSVSGSNTLLFIILKPNSGLTKSLLMKTALNSTHMMYSNFSGLIVSSKNDFILLVLRTMTATPPIRNFSNAPCRVHTHRSRRSPMIHTSHPQTSSLERRKRRQKRSQWQRNQWPLRLTDPHADSLNLRDGAGLF